MLCVSRLSLVKSAGYCIKTMNMVLLKDNTVHAHDLIVNKKCIQVNQVHVKNATLLNYHNSILTSYLKY